MNVLARPTRHSGITPLHELPQGNPARPGGARFCPEHGRWECTANRNRGRGICHMLALAGLANCRLHSGKSVAVAKAQGAAMITAWTAVGAQPTINYTTAVLATLQMTWLRLHMYAEMLRRQVAAQGTTNPTLNRDGEGEDGEMPEVSGIIGYRYGAAGKDGIVYVQTEEIRALVALEAAERERVVKFAKTAHDMGIKDKMVDAMERWGDLVSNRISALLADLDLTPAQMAKVPDLLTAHLTAIDGDLIGAAVIKEGLDQVKV